MASTRIPILNCPTRRPAITCPVGQPAITGSPPAPTDNAMCGEASLGEGKMHFQIDGLWNREGKKRTYKNVTDGTGWTYLVGEKSVNPLTYRSGTGP